jgi:lipopolysaccharide/colanic/teichoic acid biosynthesis glycosyltransferase
MIIPALPIIGMTLLLVKMTSRGPGLYSQIRLGRHGRPFAIYKIRTMRQDAERFSGAAWSVPGDSRITPVGRFLRATHLDELPQLWNVLRGDMSLVGPRPLAVRDYNGITEDWQRRRLSVPPGITCLWQVMGRSSIPFERWMELDLEYIDNWSLLLDLKICLKTVPAVITGDGAS